MDVEDGKSPVGAYKRVEALQFLVFSKQFLLYHWEGMKSWPGWYFICLAIYLATIDGNFISIYHLLILPYFQFNEISQGYVTTDQEAYGSGTV